MLHTVIGYLPQFSKARIKIEGELSMVIIYGVKSKGLSNALQYMIDNDTFCYEILPEVIDRAKFERQLSFFPDELLHDSEVESIIEWMNPDS